MPDKVRVAKRGNVREITEIRKGKRVIIGTENVVTNCPDCTRGLTSIDGVLVCPTALEDGERRAVALRLVAGGARLGDVIACGRPL